MADNKTGLFVTIVIFWTLVIVFSNYFYSETKIEIVYGDTNDLVTDSSINTETEVTGVKLFLSNLFTSLDDIPILNKFVPLFRIMSFQYNETIPSIVSWFVNLYLIFSGYVVFLMIRGD